MLKSKFEENVSSILCSEWKSDCRKEEELSARRFYRSEEWFHENLTSEPRPSQTERSFTQRKATNNYNNRNKEVSTAWNKQTAVSNNTYVNNYRNKEENQRRQANYAEPQVSRGQFNNPPAKYGEFLEDCRRQYNNPRVNNHYLEDHGRRYNNYRANNHDTNNPRVNNHFLKDRGRRRYNKH